MFHRARRLRALRLSLLAIAACIILPLVLGGAKPADTPEAVVRRAWALAGASGSYRYQAVIDQTSWPAASLTSPGRAPRVEHLALEGSVDTPNAALELRLWSGADRSPAKAHALRLADGRVEQRTGLGAWQPADAQAINVIAPGGNLLSFLGGAHDFALVGSETRRFDPATGAAVDLTLSYRRYRFQLDGSLLADNLGQEIEAQFRASHSVPAGMRMDFGAAYRQLSGQGEVWIDQDGLPRRLALQLEFPAQGNQGRSSATVSSDYAGFDYARIAVASTPFLQNPLGWVEFRLSSHAALLRRAAFNLGMCAGLALLLGLWLRRLRHRPVHAFTVGLVLASMLFAPLLNARSVSAFVADQNAQRAAAERQQQAEQRFNAARSAVAANAWDPHRDPRQAAPRPEASADLRALLQRRPELALPGLLASADATDSDGDGLTDYDEEVWGACPSASSASEDCEGVADPTDSDGDGLGDGAEVNELGLLPDEDDSDGDLINDQLEVEGFSYGGTQWYLDGYETDTNSDGLTDGLECLVWTETAASYDPAAVCPDLDGDGTPDVFDLDNDDDGVADAVDYSPNGVISQTFNGDTPLELTINNLELNKPVYVDLQIRPTNPDQINYFGTVLDWPSGDDAGQVQRHLATTFADTANTDLLSSDANAANGDIRLVPMLQFRMPYTTGHYANLPVASAYSGIDRTLAMDVDDWIDSAELDRYELSVYDSSDGDGDLLAYLPVSFISDATGGGVEGFAARMLYEPSQGSNGVATWGAAQEIRLVWLVQMITDECADSSDLSTCEDSFAIIQTYYEDWTLAGLTVTEEHGTDAAIVYENPGEDSDLSLDSDLWMASWNMSNTFLRGRDCASIDGSGACVSNGARDVTISNLGSSFDSWAGGAAKHDLAVRTLSYEHNDDFVSDLTVTQTADLLDTVFTPYASQTNPTLLFASEHRSRSVNVDDSAVSGGAVTLDFDSDLVPLTTEATMSWAPYQYADGAWANYDTEQYLTLLDTLVEDDEFFQGDASDTSLEEISGKKIWAQAYYAALLEGLSETVEADGDLLWTQSYAVPETSYTPAWASATNKGFTFIGYAYLNMIIETASKAWKYAGTNYSFWSVVNHAYKNGFSQYTFAFERLLQNKKAIALHGLIGVTTVALAVGATLFAIGYMTGDEDTFQVGMYILNAASVVGVGLYLANMTAKFSALYKSGMGVTAILKSTSMAKFKAVGKFGVVLGAIIPWIIFLATESDTLWKMITTGEGGSIALSVYTAYTLAATIITVVMFALEFVPVVGQIFTFLFLILYMVDAILFLVGEQTITDRMTEELSKLIYDVDIVIKNMDASDRLDVSVTGRTLSTPGDGFVKSNSISYTLDVTNTIRYGADSTAGEARHAAFLYTLDDAPIDRSAAVSESSMSGDWDAIGGRKLQLKRTISSTAAVPLSSIGTGINRSFDGELYLNEAYQLPYSGCWFGAFSCSVETFAGYTYLNLGAGEALDIFPDTLSEFYALDWNAEGALAFPAQQDQDGDGLLNSAAGGIDPDDSARDGDGDTLLDTYELAQGTDPELADSDADGLDDDRELVLETNPLLNDSDSDGLDDYTESTTGWRISYGLDSGGNRRYTRIWSDPNVADVDDDGLNDLQEFTYGFNPWVASDASLIDNLVAFSDLDVSESDAPLALSRFEEVADATVFANSSGADFSFSCASAATCPAAAQSGRYGSALLFDGVNDYVETTESLAPTAFTTAAWVYPTSSDTAFHGIVGYDGGVVARRAPSIYAFQNGRIQAGFGDGAAWYSLATSGAVLTSNAWNHIAFTFDGTTMRIYLNGVEQTNSTSASGKTPYPVTALRIGRLDNYFKGSIDEVALFDRALAAAEISALKDGRYNADDLIVAPGDSLSYAATVTNTLAAQGVHGHLIGESSASDPAVAGASVALRFEEDDRKSGYSPDSGESAAATCTGSACPASEIVAGSDRAVYFDGVDDGLDIGTLAYENAFVTSTLSFKIKLRSWPNSPATMTVLETDSSQDYGLNLSIVNGGYLKVALNGISPAVTGVKQLLQNTWYTVSVSVNDKQLRTYIDGVLDSGLNNNTRLRLVVGSGRLGSGSGGSSALAGSLNDLKIVNNNSATVFALGFNENNTADSRTSFINTASGGSTVTCASTTTCPALVAGASGAAVSFDGVDDYLPLTTTTSANAGASGSVSFKLKLAALPAAGSYYYLIDNARSGSSYQLKSFIDSEGKITLALLQPSTGNTPINFTTSLAGGFSGKLNSWVSVSLSWTLAAAAGGTSTFAIATTYNSATTTATATGTATYWPLVVADSNGRFGTRQPSGALPLKGSLDDLVLTNYNVNFDQPTFTVEQVNRVNDARVAACAVFYTCPTASAAGKFGAALSFDGVDDYLILDRTIADDFTIAFWMQSSQSGSAATAWWAGYGLIDGEVAGSANDFGISLGSGGQVLFGVGSASGQETTIKGGAAADGAWHHVVATRVKQTGALKLYLDGALVASGTGGTNSLTAPSYLRLGMIQTGYNPYSGLLDEVVLIPAAVDQDGAKLLMQTTYPIIDIPDDFTTFELAALESSTVSAEASVSANAVTSRQLFEQQVEAAIDLQTTINYPVTDSNAASMPLLMPFEEVPGQTTFSNYGTTTGYSQSTEMKSPFCYTAIGCPVAGLRGVVGRAATFNGATDWLSCTYAGVLGLPCAYGEINVRTVAAWVRADRGTIADFRSHIGSSGVELDFNSLNVTIGATTYRVAIDLPENEWVHVAATIDMTGRTAKVYVNGALYGSTSLGSSGTFTGSFPSIGANRSGSFGNLGADGDFFHGAMDDLRAYATTLSASQVKQLYAESAPIMAFPFDDDDSAASTVLDASVNGYVGTLQGTSCNTVTLNWVDLGDFSGDGLRVRLRSSDELIASVPTITTSVYLLNAPASFCGEDGLVFESVAANSAVSTYATLSLDPLSLGSTGTTQFGNPPFDALTANYTYGATVTAGAAPALTDGKIGQKLVLDGRGAVEVRSPTAVSALTSTFSIMGWINPDDVAGVQQIIASGTDASATNGFSLGLNDDQLQFRTLGVKSYSGSAAGVDAGVWQHVAVVFDSSYNALFYVNGILKQTIAGSAVAKANSDDPTYIGGSASTSGVLQDLFRGQLDELAIYDRALTTNEIYSIYLRDLRWYSARSAVTVQIDTDAPTIELITASAYQANAATTLVVAASDSTSGVRLLDVGIKKATAGAYAWSSAPLCAESISAARAAAWCPSFDPTSLGGEGAYSIQFRAVDAAGNQTTSAAHTIYVDGSAPSAASAYSQTWQQLTADSADDLRWTLALAGTLSDATLSGGAAGSGVAASTVQVSLYDSTGAIAGTGMPQAASVSGAAWSINYDFANLTPSGAYTVAVSLEDAVGNAWSGAVGTVRLDGRAPTMDFDSDLLTSRYISATSTLADVAVEQPSWGGELAAFHFEQTSATAFDDHSRNDHDAICAATACPSSATGVFGKALAFDGSDDTLTITDTADLELDASTFSAWIKPSWTAGAPGYNPAILGLRDGNGARYSWHINKNYGTMELWNGAAVKTVPVTLTANTWYHLALVQAGDEWTGYLNGVPVGTVSQRFGSATGLPLNIGSATGATEFFPGQIDELAIYDRALSAAEVYALAQSASSGVGKAQVWLAPDDPMLPISPTLSFDFAEPAGSAAFSDDSGAGYAAKCTACPAKASGWTDDDALSFDGVDDGLTIAITGGISLPNFTQAAWIYPTATDSGYHAVMGYQPGSLNQQRPPSIYVTQKTRIHAGFGNGTSFSSFETGSVLTANAWNHVATTFDGTNYRLYVNGTGVFTSTAAAGKVPYPVTQLRIGQADNFFKGSIDQVRVYNRALSAGDVALLASGWQNATLSPAGSGVAGWSYAIPGGLEGLYALNLRATDAYSNTEASSTVWRGMIDMRAPQLAISAAHRGGGYAAATTYAITATDTFIDPDALITPCAGQNPTITYAYHPTLGSINSVVLRCEVAGHQQGVFTAMASDYAGNRATASATLGAPASQPGILITGPAATIAGTAPISITGGAYAPAGIQKITVLADGATVGTLTYGAGNTNLLWATTWTPQSSGAHTLTAVLTAASGVYTDTATVTVVDGYQLSVGRSGAGSGTVTSSPSGIDCGADCTEQFAASTVVTLTASPASGSTFAGWSGDCADMGACVVTMSQARSVTATFTLSQYILGVSFPGSGDGTVTVAPPGTSCTRQTPGCIISITAGTVVTLTASPQAGSVFTGWGGACAGVGPCVLTMDQPRSVSATFTLSTATATATVPTATATATATVPTATASATATATATVPTTTASATATATATVPTATATATATVPTATATTTATVPTATATAQPGQQQIFIPLIVR